MTGRLAPAEIVLRGLDAMEVVLATPDVGEAVAHARSMLEGLDSETLRRVAAYLADVAVKALAHEKDAGAVQRFIERQRLEATAQLPGAGR